MTSNNTVCVYVSVSFPQVLYTGVVDEAGEKVLARLGGRMAKGVADMNCLVTDKVRRTVKFLCAVAKGIPIVTTQWLGKVSHDSSSNWKLITFEVHCIATHLQRHTQTDAVVSRCFRVAKLGASCRLMPFW